MDHVHEVRSEGLDVVLLVHLKLGIDGHPSNPSSRVLGEGREGGRWKEVGGGKEVGGREGGREGRRNWEFGTSGREGGKGGRDGGEVGGERGRERGEGHYFISTQLLSDSPPIPVPSLPSSLPPPHLHHPQGPCKLLCQLGSCLCLSEERKEVEENII